MKILCYYCDEPVDPNARDTRQWGGVWGERNRKAGGSHGSPDVWDPVFAHARCTDRRWNPRQTMLFPPTPTPPDR